MRRMLPSQRERLLGTLGMRWSPRTLCSTGRSMNTSGYCDAAIACHVVYSGGKYGSSRSYPLQEAKDSLLADGVKLPPKGARRIDALDDESDEDVGAVDYHHEYEALVKEQAVYEEVIAASTGTDHKDLESCQHYLATEQPRDEWDCESILSTYSTLDNHPSVIKVCTAPTTSHLL